MKIKILIHTPHKITIGEILQDDAPPKWDEATKVEIELPEVFENVLRALKYKYIEETK